jgi:integrase
METVSINPLRIGQHQFMEKYGASAFRSFLNFYHKKYGINTVFNHFLDRVYEEFKKPMREQKRIAEIELSEFVEYLKDEGKSNNSIRLYFTAIQNFLKYEQVTVSMSFIGNMPHQVEKKINGKHEWKIGQIKEFVDAAQSYRDKAIILCMFQSGLAVNGICEPNYGDIQEEFEKAVLPLCLHLVRKKTGVEFKTFFGRDAVKYLRLYLATRKDLKPKSPLFTKQRVQGGEARITTSAIQSFSEIAKDLPFIEQNDGFNPARSHSLRAAFNSRLIGKIDETLREFWMGHAIGAVSRAYLNMPTEELRRLYMTAEGLLKIERSSSEEIEERGKEVKVPVEVEEKIKILKSEVGTLRDELAATRGYLNLLKEVIDKEEPGEFKEWLFQKLKREGV